MALFLAARLIRMGAVIVNVGGGACLPDMIE
jgi:hypothetical protein